MLCSLGGPTKYCKDYKDYKDYTDYTRTTRTTRTDYPVECRYISPCMVQVQITLYGVGAYHPVECRYRSPCMVQMQKIKYKDYKNMQGRLQYDKDRLPCRVQVQITLYGVGADHPVQCRYRSPCMVQMQKTPTPYRVICTYTLQGNLSLSYYSRPCMSLYFIFCIYTIQGDLYLHSTG